MEQALRIPAPRVQLSLEISFKSAYARKPAMGTLTNISLTGAFLKCSQQISPEHNKLTLTLNVSGNLRKIPAHIVWMNNQGYGVQFATLSIRDLRIIDDLIYYAENLSLERRVCMADVLKIVK